MPSKSWNKTQTQQISESLVLWFQKNARQLPWRLSKDPYAIWISEIMLQQTQVATVLDYWRRWMQRFPDVQSLASASEHEVFEVWQGLGYYSRARNIRKAANQIVERFQGRVPDNHQDLLSLPGIGPYTAGAVSSIAFGLPEPLLDGNVTRVLCRLLALESDVKRSSSQKELWAHARLLVESAACAQQSANPCGDLNQALMELGATVCSPQKPKCLICPIQNHCAACREADPEKFPVSQKAAPATPLNFQTYVLFNNKDVLMRQAPEDSRWNQGLWEFPFREHSSARGNDAQSEPFWSASDPFQFESLHEIQWKFIGKVRHSITRYKLTFHVYFGEAHKSETDSDLETELGEGSIGFQLNQTKAASLNSRAKRKNTNKAENLKTENQPAWISWNEIERLPMSSAQRKIARLALDELKRTSQN